MAPSLVHLPNGQTITVSPVFGGLFFKSNNLSTHHSIFPPGWTVILHSEENAPEQPAPAEVETTASSPDQPASPSLPPQKRPQIYRFQKPTLRNDSLFMSSISNPSSSDFKPATSPTRQIAMMLWATLYWYFHQPEPDTRLYNSASATTSDLGKPRGEWRINIKREGIFKGRNLLQKLERMGLVISEDASVGCDPDERTAEGWSEMFISRRQFWQLDPRIFLFTLSPRHQSPYQSGSPYSNAASPLPSRPNSPSVENATSPKSDSQAEVISHGLWTPAPSPSGPFESGSHLPTYFPPPPLQYTFTDGIRHPIRPKPPRQGETFYTRYIPSLGQYLSLRVASLSSTSPAHNGVVSHHHHHHTTSMLPSSSSPSALSNRPASVISLPPSSVTPSTTAPINTDSTNSNASSQTPCDVELLHRWMNHPRVSAFWGESGPRSHQEAFLRANLSNRHSFPVIGCWDGKPFGYFELYWVKEDILGRYLGGEAGEHDKGVHVLVGEEEFRGPHRVKVWLSAVVHHFFTADYRTNAVWLEPRVDNEKLISYLQSIGFFKVKEIAFPHKQSAIMKITRDVWEKPEL
ncbi:MAG: hypothetical protein M1819_005580 [Sarea resinae]|nr:MAG: hypothetical protein M1819_005580 [Sarea resinae]